MIDKKKKYIEVALTPLTPLTSLDFTSVSGVNGSNLTIDTPLTLTKKRPHLTAIRHGLRFGM